MRNPAVSVGRVPGLRRAGAKVHRAIVAHLTRHPELGAQVRASIDSGTCKVVPESLDKLAEELAETLGAKHAKRGARSTWRPELVAAFVKEAGDPEVALAGWLEGEPRQE